MGEDFLFDEHVRELLEVTPNAGQRLLELGLRQKGLRIKTKKNNK